MEIIVLSDSHGQIQNAVNVLKKFENRAKTVIHLGDYIDDVFDFERKFNCFNFITVSGNCDMGCMTPSEKFFMLENKKFFITHGHKYNVKSNFIKLSYAAEEKNADICLFGHTHIPMLAVVENVLIINPGSISYPRNGTAICSYCVIDIDENNISAKIFGLCGNGGEKDKILYNFDK